MLIAKSMERKMLDQIQRACEAFPENALGGYIVSLIYGASTDEQHAHLMRALSSRKTIHQLDLFIEESKDVPLDVPEVVDDDNTDGDTEQQSPVKCGPSVASEVRDQAEALVPRGDSVPSECGASNTKGRRGTRRGTKRAAKADATLIPL